MMADAAYSRRRTTEVRVKLSPEIAEAFSGYAGQLGVLPATLAALVVGEYVDKRSESARLTRLALLDASKRAAESFTPEALVAAQARLAMEQPELIIAAQAALDRVPMDGVGGKAGSSAVPEAAAPPRGTRGGDRVRNAT